MNNQKNFDEGQADQKAKVVALAKEHFAWLSEPGRVTTQELDVVRGALNVVISFCDGEKI
jgi:hypothetical protein